MTAVLDQSADAGWWRLDERALWSVGERVEACRRADYVRQVEVVAELWNRTSRSKDDQSVMVADLMAWWKVTRAEARDLLRHAELFRREAIHKAAREGLLSKQHLTVMDKTLAEAPEPDRDEAQLGRAAELVEAGGGRDWALAEARRRMVLAEDALSTVDIPARPRVDLLELGHFIVDRDS